MARHDDVRAPATLARDLAGLAAELEGLAAAAAAYARGRRAPNTLRAYTVDWAAFSGWCAQHQLAALPAAPETVGLYLTSQAGRLATSTLKRRLACISQAHAAAGLPSPTRTATVRDVWGGIARAHARPPRRKTPLVVEAMRQVLAVLDDSPRGRRDRALLLIGWGGALRRSELVGLDHGVISLVDEGLILALQRGKTLAPGETRLVGVPRGRTPQTCPVEAWLAWGECIDDNAPPAFRVIDDAGVVTQRRCSDRSVARLVKRVALAAGLQGDYSGHSLRSGLATSAALAGAQAHTIMAQTGHRSLAMAQTYIRPTSLFADNAAAVAAL